MRESTSGKEREKETPAEQGAQREAPSQDPGIMTSAEGRCLTDLDTQVSLNRFFKKDFIYLFI